MNMAYRGSMVYQYGAKNEQVAARDSRASRWATCTKIATYNGVGTISA